MHHCYSIFGLNIKSEIPLPACPVANPEHEGAPDITIEYGNAPAALSDPQAKGIRFQAGPGEFLLRVDGVARYFVQAGNSITIMPEDKAHEDDVLVFLMGTAMGALLHQRKILTLHAGAIDVNGEAVIFSGPSGAGKSTLTAGFHKRGYPFLADDVCAVAIRDGKPFVVPGFPQLKLWADTLDRITTDRKTLKSVRWGNDMEKFFLHVDQCRNTPVPLKSVFILGTSEKEHIEVTAINGGEKIDPLIKNTYRFRFLKGLGGKKDHFQQCASVAARAGVYRTVRPLKGFRLKELMDMMEEKF